MMSRAPRVSLPSLGGEGQHPVLDRPAANRRRRSSCSRASRSATCRRTARSARLGRRGGGSVSEAVTGARRPSGAAARRRRDRQRRRPKRRAHGSAPSWRPTVARCWCCRKAERSRPGSDKSNLLAQHAGRGYVLLLYWIEGLRAIRHSNGTETRLTGTGRQSRARLIEQESSISRSSGPRRQIATASDRDAPAAGPCGRLHGDAPRGQCQPRAGARRGRHGRARCGLDSGVRLAGDGQRRRRASSADRDAGCRRRWSPRPRPSGNSVLGDRQLFCSADVSADHAADPKDLDDAGGGDRVSARVPGPDRWARWSGSTGRPRPGSRDSRRRA